MTPAPLSLLLSAATAVGGANLSPSTIDDGVAAAEPRRPGEAAVLTIAVVNDGDEAASAVVVRDAFAACLDLSGFDPERRPEQVVVAPGPASVRFDPRTRTLEIAFANPIVPGPSGAEIIRISGLAWSASSAPCCTRPQIVHDSDPIGFAASDAELGAGPTCASVSAIAQRPPRVRDLLATRSGTAARFEWNETPRAASYNVWRVAGGEKRLIPDANVVGARSRSEIRAACLGVAADARRCRDEEPLAAPGGEPTVIFYQVRGALSDGSEGTLMAPSCGAAASVTLSSSRPSIPSMAAPDGSCGTPGPVLPIQFQALVLDGLGAALPDCEVMFYIDFSNVSSCGRGFGQFCGPTTVGLTDSLGVASVNYTMLQEDLDFCNCLPSGNKCQPSSGGFCPDPVCAPICNASADIYCEIAVGAFAGTHSSLNSPVVEYGR